LPASRAGRSRAARETGLLGRAERRCASRSWRRRLRAVRLLTALGGGEATVPPLLRDPRVEVRTQAAEWAAEHPDPATTEALVEMLGDPVMLARFTVQDALTRLGRAACPALDRAIRVAEGDAITGALRVAAGVPEPALGAAALTRAGDPDPRVRAGVARVLGATGGEAAVAALERLLADEDAPTRAAAAAALSRLRHWPAAAKLGGRLSDPSWDVRRASALGLRSFGAVGEILLRRALKDEDRFARDIATLALDLPEAVASS
jgi:HEAT repeat protein